MRVHILLASPLKDPGIRGGVDEYIKRARQHFDVRITCVKGERVARPEDASRALAREAERLTKATPSGAMTVALAVQGKAWSSERLATWLGTLRDGSVSDIAVYIGSAYGLDAQLERRCDLQLSLSTLTLPHQLAVLVLCEQIYRSSSILAGAPYHK